MKKLRNKKAKNRLFIFLFLTAIMQNVQKRYFFIIPQEDFNKLTKYHLHLGIWFMLFILMIYCSIIFVNTFVIYF